MKRRPIKVRFLNCHAGLVTEEARTSRASTDAEASNSAVRMLGAKMKGRVRYFVQIGGEHPERYRNI